MNDLASPVFRAVSDPTRRKIIELLSRSRRSVKELTANFAMSQSAVSQHLRELRAAGVVESERVGVEQFYRLTADPLSEVFRWVSSYRTVVDPAGHAWELVPGKGRETGMAIEGSVPRDGAIVPHLVVSDAAGAVEFYERAFGAKVLYRSPSPSGDGEHIHLKIWSSLVQVSTEEPAYRRSKLQGWLLASPETLLGSTCVFQVSVPDVDSAFERAVREGGLPAMPPMDMFWGDRYGWIRDPFGHMWALCTVREVLTPQQAEERLRGFAAGMRGQE